jgi:hypothetical protein
VLSMVPLVLRSCPMYSAIIRCENQRIRKKFLERLNFESDFSTILKPIVLAERKIFCIIKC